LLLKKCFRRSPYDKYAFTTGRGDAVILFDDLNAVGVKKYIPTAKNIFVAAHPLADYDNPYKIKFGSNSKKLLVNFSQNLTDELKPDNLDKWVFVINKVSQFKSIKEIHLRCHPRTSKNVKWPYNVLAKLKNLGYTVSLIDPLQNTLVDTISNYCGVIGSPSNSLIVARAVSNGIFVTCLPNCSSGSPDDQSWTMGGAEGINIISDNEDIGKKHFKVGSYDPKIFESKKFIPPKRKTVPEILNELLEVH